MWWSDRDPERERKGYPEDDEILGWMDGGPEPEGDLLCDEDSEDWDDEPELDRAAEAELERTVGVEGDDW